MLSKPIEELFNVLVEVDFQGLDDIEFIVLMQHVLELKPPVEPNPHAVVAKTSPELEQLGFE
jgi:hypothetical protein